MSRLRRIMSPASIVSYDTLTAVPKFNDMIKNGPQAGTLISLRGALSLILQSKPTLPYEKWLKPTIAFQPGSDRMTPPKYIKKVFDRIGSKDKKYIQLEGSAHFPVEEEYYVAIATENPPGTSYQACVEVIANKLRESCERRTGSRTDRHVFQNYYHGSSHIFCWSALV